MATHQQRRIDNVRLRNISIHTLFYALSCAVILTMVHHLVGKWEIITRTEYTIYDAIQDSFAIDSADDLRYDRYREEFEHLLAIDLDSSFIDKESERVRRDKLADLLGRLDNGDSLAIFLFYDFEPLGESGAEQLRIDSILCQRILDLGERIVLYRTKASDRRSTDIAPLTNCDLKKVNGMASDRHQDITSIDEKARFLYTSGASEGDQVPIVTLINKVFAGERGIRTHSLPEELELNYILRDNRSKGRLPALQKMSGEVALKSPLDLAEQTDDYELLFIGPFSKVESKYKYPIFSIVSPISSDLSSIYIQINGYLNIATNSFLRDADWLVILTVNFTMALLGALYYLWDIRSRGRYGCKKWSLLGFEILICLITTLSFVTVLFLVHFIKYPFVIAGIFLIRNQVIFRNFYNYLLVKPS